MSFGWEYPPGVTGGESEIAGPDFEQEVPDDYACVDHEDSTLTLFGYGYQRWIECWDNERGESHEIARWDVEPGWGEP